MLLPPGHLTPSSHGRMLHGRLIQLDRIKLSKIGSSSGRGIASWLQILMRATTLEIWDLTVPSYCMHAAACHTQTWLDGSLTATMLVHRGRSWVWELLRDYLMSLVAALEEETRTGGERNARTVCCHHEALMVTELQGSS